MAPFKSYADAVSGGNKKAKVPKSSRPSATTSPAPDSAAMRSLDLGTTEKKITGEAQAKLPNSDAHSTTQTMLPVPETTQRVESQASNPASGADADVVPPNSDDLSTAQSVDPSAATTQPTTSHAPAPLSAVARYRAQVIAIFNQTGTTTHGSNSRPSCRGICRWLKERCANDGKEKRGRGADTPHQDES